MGGIGSKGPNFIKGPINIGTIPNVTTIGADGKITMGGTAKGWMKLRAEMDFTAQIAATKPTQVASGVFKGFSFPVYAADNEELFFKEIVPCEWDGVSDIVFNINVALSGIEDVGDNFKFQFSWEHAKCEGIIPATSNDVEVEVAVLIGRNAQHDQYCLEFVMNYDIDGVGNEIKCHELLGGRLRRIDATNPDVDNEIIVVDWHTHYQTDKLTGSL